MTRVLVALDESPASVRGAHAAAALFAAPQTEFLVINVTGVPAPWVSAGMYGEVWAVDPGVWTEQVDSLERDERAELEAAAADAGLDHPKILVEFGDPADSICKAAEEHDVDVVVVGSHDKNFLRRLFDPSVADRVVQRTSRPVLVVGGTPGGT